MAKGLSTPEAVTTLQAEIEICDFYSQGWIVTSLGNVVADAVNVFLRLSVLAIEPQLLSTFCLTI